MADEETRFELIKLVIQLHTGSVPNTERIENDLNALYNFIKGIKKQTNEKVHKL